MKLLRSAGLRWCNLFQKAQLDCELQDELMSHLELHIEDNLRAGMNPEEAPRNALVKLGGIEQTKESVRDHRGAPTLESFLRQLRFALRLLRRNPAFTSAAVLTLALGIGANTAIFTVVYAALLAPLPYPNPDQVVMVWSKINGHDNSVSPNDFLDWKRQSSAFQDLIAMSSGRFSLSSSGHPEVIQARITSPGFFSVQGIPLFLGRDFLPEEGTVGNEHAQRTHEIGLRMALGAGQRQVLLLVLQQGMLLASAGLVLGFGGTYFVGHTMNSILYGITAIDPLAICLVAVVLPVAAFLACYIPARRAARVDPMVALRYE